MKINSLSVQGFGPFKTEQHVNFDAFDDDGIFLMGGKTGAGKSSILDAICFALYDSVPRYDGTKARLRSDHCAAEDPTLVRLDFTAGGTRYRVERSPEYERPKARGTGTTTNKAAATLFELRGDDWHGIAASPREVGPQIAQLVGLNKDQFLQVILLAQNRFQQFLLAKSEDRQGVLRSLFGTRRFQDYELAVADQCKALELELGNRRATLAQMLAQAATIAHSADADGDAAGGEPAADATATATADAAATAAEATESLDVPGELSRTTIEPWLVHVEGVVAALLAGVDAAADSADARYRAADAAHDLLLAAHAGQLRRADATRRHEQLLVDAVELDGVRAEVAAATRADVVWGALHGARRARDAATQSNVTLVAATDAFLRIRGTGDVEDGTGATNAPTSPAASDISEASDAFDAPEAPAGTSNASDTSHASSPLIPGAKELAQLIDETTRERGTLRDGVETERDLPGRQAMLDEYQVAADAAERELAATLGRAAELPALIAADTDALTELCVIAARADDSGATIERLQHAQNAAKAAEATEAQLASARADELAAGQARTTASARLDELRAARLSGHAAELAASLRDGEACLVCGATEHPQPAPRDGPTIGQDDIDEAASAVEASQLAASDASGVANALAERLAEQRGRAGEQTLPELARALDEARAALAAATDAATTAARLDIQLADRRAELQAAEVTITTQRDTVAAATARHTAMRVRVSDDLERVARLRGTYATVAERDASLLALLTLAHELSEALAAATHGARAAASAATELASQLAANGFEHADAAEAAHLTADDRAAREQRVKAHDEALAGVMATLADPGLTRLPTELIDLEESAAALAALADARDAAISARATMLGHVSGLAALRTRIAAELTASATLIERFDVVSRLSATLEGKGPNDRRMKLESYVLAAELEQIVAAANGRLSVMSAGRYTLEHDDSIGYRGAQSGLGLSILDSHTGLHRATHSLSGGETFLASLALALGLAEVVTGRAGGIRLDTLFIDEGFGSLDADTLEIAMATLDSLRTGGRTIGLISHVEAMKEQIHASLQVRISERGWSTISQAGSVEVPAAS